MSFVEFIAEVFMGGVFSLDERRCDLNAFQKLRDGHLKTLCQNLDCRDGGLFASVFELADVDLP